MCVKSLSSHTSAPLPPPGHMYPSPSSRNWKYGDLKYFNVGIIIFSRVKRMRIIYFSGSLRNHSLYMYCNGLVLKSLMSRLQFRLERTALLSSLGSLSRRNLLRSGSTIVEMTNSADPTQTRRGPNQAVQKPNSVTKVKLRMSSECFCGSSCCIMHQARLY